MFILSPLFITLVAINNVLICDAARILGLFPHAGRSHHMVFEPLLNELAIRGHDVTVISFFPLKKPPSRLKDISLEGLAETGLENVNLELFETELWFLDDLVKKIMGINFLGELAKGICQKLADWPNLREIFEEHSDYDVILVENFNSDCLLGLAREYGVKGPVVGLLSSNLMPWSFDRLGINDNPAYVPCVASGFSSSMTFIQRIENTFLHYFLKLLYRYEIQLKEQAIIEKHFGRKITDLEDRSKEFGLMLINTHHSFNGGRPQVPGLIEIGGMHIGTTKNQLPKFIDKFINESEHGVILFSWGSLIKTSTIPKYKEDIIVKVLSELPQRVIWKYEGSSDSGTVEGNILKVNWIPQYDILQHSKVVAFIAHGGLLGMSEAIHVGVPMLVVPFFGDQPSNAVMAKEAGLAEIILYRDIEETKLRKAIQAVLQPEKLEMAKNLSRKWKDRQASPLETAVYWVERTARLGFDPTLGSPPKHMPFYQILLVDVISAFLLAIVAFLVFLFTLVRFTCCRTSKKLKQL